MADRSSTQDVTIERTSGSVFATLGYSDPKEAEAKSRLVTVLNDVIESRGLTLARASEILGKDKPALADLLRGRTGGVSIDELAQMLGALERNVTITS